MNSKVGHETAKDLARTLESFNQAIHDGGGTAITYSSMASMTLFDFIYQIAAPNGIRFHLQKPVKRKKEGSDAIQCLEEEEDF